MKMSTKLLKRLVVSTLVAIAATSAVAQGYPKKPIRFVIPYPPGGTTDLVGRAFATHLSKILGQPVVVDNRGGAAGSLGTSLVANADPDGYTLGMSSVAPFAVNPACNPKMVPYNPEKDFTPITEIANSPHAILVNPAFPAKNFSEFMALIKASPKKYAYATAGTCGTGHMVGAGLEHATNTQMHHVPYRGAGPAAIDVLSSQVPILIDGLPSTLSHIRNGRLRGLVIASKNRSEAAPDIPTFAEVGLAEVGDPSWYGLVAPAKTPDDIVRKLYEASVAALKDPGLLAQFKNAGAIPGGTTPEQHAMQIKHSLERMRRLVKSQNIMPEN